jgi:hypothetical protein
MNEKIQSILHAFLATAVRDGQTPSPYDIHAADR